MGLGININMFCETFHHVFKYTYLKGKANKRVDKCLVNLIKLNRDKTFERIKKLTKGKLTQKLSMIQARHRNSLNLDFGSVTQSEDNSWICKSEDGNRNYTVILNSQRCDDRQCSLKCSSCNICVHTYTCSCMIFCYIPQYVSIFILFTSTKRQMKERPKFVKNRLLKETMTKMKNLFS